MIAMFVIILIFSILPLPGRDTKTEGTGVAAHHRLTVPAKSPSASQNTQFREKDFQIVHRIQVGFILAKALR